LHENQDGGLLLVIIGYTLRHFYCSVFRPREEVFLCVACLEAEDPIEMRMGICGDIFCTN
jgi:hypothetical protein